MTRPEKSIGIHCEETPLRASPPEQKDNSAPSSWSGNSPVKSFSCRNQTAHAWAVHYPSHGFTHRRRHRLPPPNTPNPDGVSLSKKAFASRGHAGKKKARWNEKFAEKGPRVRSTLVAALLLAAVSSDAKLYFWGSACNRHHCFMLIRNVDCALKYNPSRPGCPSAHFFFFFFVFPCGAGTLSCLPECCSSQIFSFLLPQLLFTALWVKYGWTWQLTILPFPKWSPGQIMFLEVVEMN